MLRPPNEEPTTEVAPSTAENGTADSNSVTDQDRKKRKLDDDKEGAGENSDELEGKDVFEAENIGDCAQIRRKQARKYNPDLQTRNISVARPVAEMKGHTAFLTFAVAPHVLDRIGDSKASAVADRLEEAELRVDQDGSSDS